MTLDQFNDRKRAKIALVSEYGGDNAPWRLAALEAISRGLYSSKTTLGDIESALQRVWRQWKRTRPGEAVGMPESQARLTARAGG